MNKLKQGLDLEKIKQNIDAALDNETKESLTDWLMSKRQSSQTDSVVGRNSSVIGSKWEDSLKINAPDKQGGAVYRKVSVKERLPQMIEYYFTSVGLMYFNGNAFEAANLKHEYVDYWLEEVELPSEENIIKQAQEYAQLFPHFWNARKQGFEEGANKVKNFVLAATAKDNVR